MEGIMESDKKSIYGLLLKLIYLVDAKDSYLKSHSENVTKYALLLGEELNLNSNKMELLEISAMLHDVGKIGIPDYLLVKNSRLTDNEYEIMKRHSTIGEALFPLEGYDDIKRIIRAHHERLDGKGYPDGLKRHEIPYLARILAVVDTFDAMTTKRSYNEVKTLEEALEELKAASKRQVNCGDEDFIQQLDPFIVEVFVKMIRNNVELMEEFRMKDLNIMNNRNKVKYKKIDN